MSLFTGKKGRKHNIELISRIPYGNTSLAAYEIRPYTSSLVKGLNEQLNDIMKNSPDSIDGQNGDVLDNYIKNWKNRAKANLNKQRSVRANVINQVDTIRKANIQNATDWLEVDKEKLQKLRVEIQEMQEKYEDEIKNYFNW